MTELAIFAALAFGKHFWGVLLTACVRARACLRAVEPAPVGTRKVELAILDGQWDRRR